MSPFGLCLDFPCNKHSTSKCGHNNYKSGFEFRSIVILTSFQKYLFKQLKLLFFQIQWNCLLKLKFMHQQRLSQPRGQSTNDTSPNLQGQIQMLYSEDLMIYYTKVGKTKGFALV